MKLNSDLKILNIPVTFNVSKEKWKKDIKELVDMEIISRIKDF